MFYDLFVNLLRLGLQNNLPSAQRDAAFRRELAQLRAEERAAGRAAATGELGVVARLRQAFGLV